MTAAAGFDAAAYFLFPGSRFIPFRGLPALDDPFTVRSVCGATDELIHLSSPTVGAAGAANLRATVIMASCPIEILPKESSHSFFHDPLHDAANHVHFPLSCSGDQSGVVFGIL